MKMFNYPSTNSLNDEDKMLVAKPTSEEDGFETHTIKGSVLKAIFGMSQDDIQSLMDRVSALESNVTYIANQSEIDLSENTGS